MALDDDDATFTKEDFAAFLRNEGNDTRMDRLARASSYYCDGNQIERLKDLPTGSFDTIWMRDPEPDPPWWTEAEVTRHHRDVVLRSPFLEHLISEPKYAPFRSRIVLAASALYEAQRLIKPTGNVLVQCEPDQDYIYRLILNEIFGDGAFREIIAWHRGMYSANSVKNGFVNNKDHIIRYEMPEATFRPIYRPCTFVYAKMFNMWDDDGLHAGRPYRRQSLTGGTWGKPIPWTSLTIGKTYLPRRAWAPPRKYVPTELWGDTLRMLDWLDLHGYIIHPQTSGAMPDYKQFAEDTIEHGNCVGDIWACYPGTEGVLRYSKDAIDQDVKSIGGCLKRLLDATIAADATPRVLLPFCDKADLIAAACLAETEWVALGYDAADLLNVQKKLHRIGVKFEPDLSLWLPTTLAEAKKLREHDPGRDHCERISLTWFGKAVNASRRPRPKDRGVDGEFHLMSGNARLRIFVSVKSGKVDLAHLRDLQGAMDRAGLYSALDAVRRRRGGCMTMSRMKQ